MAITILKHPRSGAYSIGQPLIVVAIGDHLMYQWQKLVSGDWVNIPAANTPEYYPREAGTVTYRVLVIGSASLLTEDEEILTTEALEEILSESDTISEPSNAAVTTFTMVKENRNPELIAYIKSNEDFSTKDILQFDTYSIIEDIEFSEKSSILVTEKPNITDDDFVVLKKGNRVIFFGICEDYSSGDSTGYTITLKQAPCLFDRQIFTGDESLIAEDGIEDFIKSEIEANWTDSGDALLDKDYITVVAGTHTPINATVDSDNGVYNLKTFIGNAKEYYGIFLDYEFTNSELTITVRKDAAAPLPIDVTVSDIDQYQETYNIDVLAKLLVKWKQQDSETVNDAVYYLKTDRTITTDGTDPDRANGVVKSVFMEKESIDEVYQDAVNEFKSNSYEHKISFGLFEGSKAYPVSEYYVGRSASIKTKTGIKTSLITKMSSSSDSRFVNFEFGKLKVTLIDKIRGMQ